MSVNKGNDKEQQKRYPQAYLSNGDGKSRAAGKYGEDDKQYLIDTVEPAAGHLEQIAFDEFYQKMNDKNMFFLDALCGSMRNNQSPIYLSDELSSFTPQQSCG